MPKSRTGSLPEEFAEDWELLRSLRESPKSYVGRRTSNEKAVVKVVERNGARALPLCRNLFPHSHGFEWGYAGSGPAQLALAILHDHLKDPEKAVRYHQKFKSMVVAQLPNQGWELPESVVRDAIRRIENSTSEENSES